MNSGEDNLLEARQQALLTQLQQADGGLRTSLHQEGTDGLVRAHLERALAHIREASIAVEERIKIRSVQQLARELDRIQEMLSDLRARQTNPSHSIRP